MAGLVDCPGYVGLSRVGVVEETLKMICPTGKNLMVVLEGSLS